MINFQPDQVAFGDAPGYGMFDDGHYREHLAFVQAFAVRTPSVLIPDYNLLQFLNAGDARKAQTESHAKLHSILRPLVGITGVDFTAFNFDDQNDFNDFLGYHRDEHAQIRQFLGMT